MLSSLLGKQKNQKPPTNEMEAFYLQQFMSSNQPDKKGNQPMNAQNPFLKMPAPTDTAVPHDRPLPNQPYPQPSPYPQSNYPQQPPYPQQAPFTAPQNAMQPNSLQSPYPNQAVAPQQMQGYVPPLNQPNYQTPSPYIDPSLYANSHVLPQQNPYANVQTPPGHHQALSPTPYPTPHAPIGNVQASAFMTPQNPAAKTPYPDMQTPYMPQLLPTDFSGVHPGTHQKSFEPSISDTATTLPPLTTPNQTTYIERQLEQHEQRIEHLNDRLRTIETYLNLIPPK